MNDNPFLRRTERVGAVGRKSERKTSQRLGAKLTPASGAASSKGDMTRGDWMVEAKSTTNDSMSLKYAWLSKVNQEAGLSGKRPALAITFTHADGRPLPDGNWVAIPEDVFKELFE